MTPSRFRWGVLLVLVGIVLLMRNSGIVYWGFWWEWASFLPIVLIAIGVEKIFTGSKLQFISYLTSILLFIGGLYIALGERFDFSSSDASSSGSSDFNLSQDGDVHLIKVTLDLKNTNLTVRDAGEKLVEARFDQTIRAPKVDHSVSDGIANVDIESRKKDFFGGAVKIDFDELEDWYFRFSRDVPLDLTCESNQSDLHLNLADNPVQRLKVDAQDDNIYVKIGTLTDMVHIEINGIGASLRLRMPQGSGLKVESSEYHDYFGQLGMHEEDGGYISDNYDTEPVKVDLKLGNSLRQISVDYY